MKRRFLCLSIVLASALAAHAHPPDASGHHDAYPHAAGVSRNWTNVRTGEVVKGTFLASYPIAGATRVSIERDNGDVVLVAMADLDASGQAEAQKYIAEVEAINHEAIAAPAGGVADRPFQATPFDKFAPFVSTRWDDRWLYVESDGLPHVPGARDAVTLSHPLMVGITAWQQQVPLAQNYRGNNAWRLPLKPELAERPVSAKEQLFRGAIALAANGVPIFNPIKNDGRTDTLIAGELDEFGGHCGRADDYHYHIAPTHLQRYLGKTLPIAYALDGFPIYGLFDPAARSGADQACPLGSTDPLDELNGHFGAPQQGAAAGSRGLYHYHASAGYPYLNGGLRGKVTVKEDQIDPQPSATPVRDWLQPLRGAKITGFKHVGGPDERAWSLEYTVAGKKGFVNYRVQGEGAEAKYQFEFIGTDGVHQTSEYTARAGGRRGPPDANGEQRPPRNGDQKPPRDGRRPKQDAPRPATPVASSGFSLSSPDVTDGRLAKDCTCDGASRQPVLTWNDPPAGTKAIAIAMHHIAPDGDTHVYLGVADLPAAARKLEGQGEGGVWGVNTVNRKPVYTPPCSQGPGDKTYTISVYALSAPASLAAGFTRDQLLDAIKDKTLATASIDVVYARASKDAPPDQPGKGGGKRGPRADRDQPPPDAQPGLLARMTSFKTDVPAHDSDVLLVRPTDHSITVSVMAAAPSRAQVEYWPSNTADRKKTAPLAVTPRVATNIEINGLSTGAAYQYRVGLTGNSGAAQWSEPQEFRTRPKPGHAFTFVVQADSHLDQGVDPRVYEQTLANMRADRPELFIDLGDTFMTDKRGPDFKSAQAQYDAQRWYFSRLCTSTPLFMVLGNHDGEKGSSGRGPDDIGPWSFLQRTSRFPAPVIDGSVYTGATGIADGLGSHHYAFEWGDALFIVLDPFWPTLDRIRGAGNKGGGGQPRADSDPLKPIDASWVMTLGRDQYDWLARTLSSSHAAHRFVFIHHLVGGFGGPEARGGGDSSSYFEWGGLNADGTSGFASQRPGWPLPIHDLLVKHHVSAVLHGHDHLYVRTERDGLVYQCVPQPGNPVGNTRSAEQYGYRSGVTYGSPGYLRVQVTPAEAQVQFVRTAVEGVDADDRRSQKRQPETNGQIIHQYTLVPRSATPATPARKP